MLKVLLSTTLAQSGKTGVFQHMMGLLEGFREAELPVEFTLLGQGAEKDLFGRFFPWARWHSCCPGRRPAWQDLLWHQLRLPALAQRLGVDLVHIPSYRRSLFSRKVAQVVTVHDCHALDSGKYGRTRALMAQWMLRMHVSRARAVITVSQSTRSHLESLGVRTRSLTVIPNGVGADYSEGREPRRDLLYVSRLEHPGKNHLNLIEAFELYRSRHPDGPRLVLVGEPWDGFEQIRQRVARSNYSQQIEIRGFVEGSLASLYQSAQALVYPSRAEGFGIPLVEAMACGCPVLCSDLSVFREVAGDAASYFDHTSPAAMAECFELNLQPQRLSRLSELGLQRSRAFRWRDSARSTYEVYRRALA